MTDTITATHVLTATDARALRNADAIVFHHRDGEGYIRAIQRAEHSSTGFEQEHKIPARMSTITDYGNRAEVRTYDAVQVFTSAKHHEELRTVVNALRANTEFVLQWVRDNSSPVSREIGFHRDELRIRIGKVGAKRADSYLLGVYAGPDNSARMVRMA